MAGGIDLALAELISEWRITHPQATLEEIVDFVAALFSNHKHHKQEMRKSFLNKPLTIYVISDTTVHSSPSFKVGNQLDSVSSKSQKTKSRKSR